MNKSKKTKNKILVKSAKLMYYNGYKNTSLNMILEKCNIAKGQFYYYFKSKEDLLIEIIEYHTQNMLKLFNDKVIEVSIDTIKEFFFEYFNQMEKNKYYGGSPLGNLILELSDINENVREKLEKSYQQLIIRISFFIKILRNNLTIEEAENISNLILSTFEGTLLRMKLSKNGDCIKSFFYLFDKIIFFDKIDENKIKEIKIREKLEKKEEL